MFKAKSTESRSTKTSNSRLKSGQSNTSSTDPKKTLAATSKTKVLSSLSGLKSSKPASSASSPHLKEKHSQPSLPSGSNVKTSQARPSGKPKSSTRTQSHELSLQQRNLHSKSDYFDKKYLPPEMSHHRNSHERIEYLDKKHSPSDDPSHMRSLHSKVHHSEKKPILDNAASHHRTQHSKHDPSDKKHRPADFASLNRHQNCRADPADKKNSSSRPSSVASLKPADKSATPTASRHSPKSSHAVRSTASGAKSNYVSPLQRQSIVSTRPHRVAKRDNRIKPSTVHVQKSNSMQNRVASKPRRNSAVKLSSDHSPAPRKDTHHTSSSKKQNPSPLPNDYKKPPKGLPPTAVVQPIQDKSKDIISQLNDKSDDVSLEKKSNDKIHMSSTLTDSGYRTPKKSQSFPNLAILNTPDDPSVEEVDDSPIDLEEEKNEETIETQTPLQMGHFFQPHLLKEWVNWCDACGGVILSLFNASVTCAKCNMVCHRKCAFAVSLTCAADEQLSQSDVDDSNNKAVVEETKDEATLKEFNTIKRVLPLAEVQGRIDVFNRTVKGIQQMTLLEDGETFRGFIRVSMNLTRPVSVTHHWSKLARKLSEKQEKKASFYVDKGALKALHVTSDTTSEQVVRMLLQKYNITDNPMKFALFEKQVREEDHVILRKMLPRERPLFLRLLWGNGIENDTRQFILQENESRDIEWEAFSIAELHMFIKILNKEENDYVVDIKRKYRHKAEDIKKAMEYQNRTNS